MEAEDSSSKLVSSTAKNKLEWMMSRSVTAAAFEQGIGNPSPHPSYLSDSGYGYSCVFKPKVRKKEKRSCLLAGGAPVSTRPYLAESGY